jgi:hypothetical protein
MMSKDFTWLPSWHGSSWMLFAPENGWVQSTKTRKRTGPSSYHILIISHLNPIKTLDYIQWYRRYLLFVWSCTPWMMGSIQVVDKIRIFVGEIMLFIGQALLDCFFDVARFKHVFFKQCHKPA